MLDKQELIARHPLFSKLSGQVIWLLFEEHDADPADIGAFMDHFMPHFTGQLDVLRRLLEHPDGWLRIRVSAPPGAESDAARAACPACAALDGSFLAASDPRLAAFLPPYSLGCRARAEFVDAAAFAALDAPRLLPPDAPTPPRELHCPSEWLFSHPWAKTPRPGD
jgi:hypothetical protein